MKLKMLLFAVLILGTYSLYGQKPMEEDPYLLWQTTDPLGYSGFVIHPNGNIIANRGAEIFELDGNTGQVIRKYPQFVNTNVEDMDVTKDGKIFGAGFGNIILYDLENDTVIGGVSETNGLFAFFPDSKRFIARSTKLPPSNLLVYNMDTKERTELGVNYVPWALATSPDGKYFATGGTSSEFDIIDGEVYYTILTLWDAETLQPIKELAKIGGDFEVRSIKFSPDGKYVGVFKSLVDVLIFELDNNENIKNFLGGNFCILKNNLLAFYSSNFPIAPPDIIIKDFLNDKQLYSKRAKNGGNNIEHNHFYNSVIFQDAGQLFSLDLNKIITSVDDPINPETFTVNYNKDTLILYGLNSIMPLNITISDISGKVIRKLNVPVTNSEIRIPLILPNGTYLVHVKDGNKEYTSKFLVME